MNDNDIQIDPRARAAVQGVEIIENRLQTYVAAKILTPEQYQTAASELRNIKEARKVMDDARKAMTGPLDKAKAVIMDFFRGPGDRLDDAERKLKRALLDYDLEQQHIADQERRRAEEAASRERNFQEQRAARLAEQGALAAATEAMEQAARVQTPTVVAATPKASGIAYRDVYKWQVIDESLLPREFMSPDLAKIRQRVELSKGECEIPGVKVWTEKQIAARRRS